MFFIKKIKKIKLLGLKFKVVHVNDLRDPQGVALTGRAKGATAEILMDNDSSSDGYLTTLIHEIFHHGMWAMGMHLSEDDLERLSTMGLSLIRDNPKLIELIRK